MVQFGVHVGAQNATVEELRTLWKWLDEAGADWISLWDHLYEAPPAGGTQPHFEAFSMLGALAVDTSRARIGCLVFCSNRPAFCGRGRGLLPCASVMILSVID